MYLKKLYQNNQINFYLVLILIITIIINNLVAILFGYNKAILLGCVLVMFYLFITNLTYTMSSKILLSSVCTLPYLIFYFFNQDYLYIKFAASTLLCLIVFNLFSNIVQNDKFKIVLKSNINKLLQLFTLLTFFYFIIFIIFSNYNNLKIHENNFSLIYYQSLITKDFNFFEHTPSVALFMLIVIKVFLFVISKKKLSIPIFFYACLILDLSFFVKSKFLVLFFFLLAFGILFLILKKFKIEFKIFKKIFFTSFILTLIGKYLITYNAWDLLFYFSEDDYYIMQKHYIFEKLDPLVFNNSLNKLFGSFSAIVNLKSLTDRLFYYWLLPEHNIKLIGGLGDPYNLKLFHDIFLTYYANFGLFTICLAISLYSVYAFIKSEISLLIYIVALSIGMFDQILFMNQMSVAISFWFLIGIFNYRQNFVTR